MPCPRHPYHLLSLPLTPHPRPTPCTYINSPLGLFERLVGLHPRSKHLQGVVDHNLRVQGQRHLLAKQVVLQIHQEAVQALAVAALGKHAAARVQQRADELEPEVVCWRIQRRVVHKKRVQRVEHLLGSDQSRIGQLL